MEREEPVLPSAAASEEDSGLVVSPPAATRWPTFQCDDDLVVAPDEAAAYRDFLRPSGTAKKMLIQAVKDGELEVVRKLFRYCGGQQASSSSSSSSSTPDVQVDLADGYGNSLLHYAAYYGHAQLVEFLARGGATVDSRNNVGNTPLQLACEAGRVACAELLVRQCGADVHAANMTGWTPLHTAAHAGSVDCARLLVEAGGADLTQACTRGGSTPADCAKDHPDVLAWLASLEE
jgi:ankyrin repeat protein